MTNILKMLPPGWKKKQAPPQKEMKILAMRKISNRRIETLKEHLRHGGKCMVELGCGDGAFSAGLSRSLQQWVLGIDHDFDKLLFDSPTMNLEKYKRCEKFVFVDCRYEDAVNTWNENFAWLSGAVSKVFMIMPFPSRNFNEELQLWLKMAAPRGELHVRTEDGDLISKLVFPRPVKSIPFYPEVENIPSAFTSAYAAKNGGSLLSFGFQLL